MSKNQLLQNFNYLELHGVEFCFKKCQKSLWQTTAFSAVLLDFDFFPSLVFEFIMLWWDLFQSFTNHYQQFRKSISVKKENRPFRKLFLINNSIWFNI